MDTEEDEKKTLGTRLREFGEKLKLTAGTEAALTVCLLYISIGLIFTLVFVATIPRSASQVYNVTVSSEDYDASLRIEIEHFYKPLLIQMLCNTSDNNQIQIIYDVDNRIIVYKNERKHWCYIRPGVGTLFQKDMQNFKDLILGDGIAKAEPKRTVHLLLIPVPVPNDQLIDDAGKIAYNFCKEQQTFWLSSYYEDALAKRRAFRSSIPSHRKRSYHPSKHIDVCFQNLVIHQQ